MLTSSRLARHTLIGFLFAFLMVGTLATGSQSASAVSHVTPSSVVTDDAYWTQVTTAIGSGIRGYAMDVATDGSLIVTGSFTGQASFPTGGQPISLTAGGASEIFVAGFDQATGHFTWAQQTVGAGASGGSAFDIAVRGDGTAVLTGQLQGTVDFPTGGNTSVTLAAGGQTAIVVAGVDPATGHFTWAHRAGDPNSPNLENEGRSIASRGTSIVVTGSFDGTATFPTDSQNSLTVTSAGNSDVFVAGLDPATGYFTWVQRAGGTSTDSGIAVAIGSLGQPFVTGSFNGQADFPTGVGQSITLTAGVNADIFVAALDPQTRFFTWAQKAGGDGFDRPKSLVLTADDTPIIAGRFAQTADFPTGPGAGDSIALVAAGIDIFISGLDPATGYFTWAQQASGPDTDEAFSVALTPSGSAVLAGVFKDSVSFPTGAGATDVITLNSPVVYDAFVAGFDPATGYFTWVQSADGSGSDTYAEDVVIDGSGTPVVVGTFSQTVTFPSGPSTNITVTAEPVAANGNVFIGSMRVSAPVPPPVPLFPPSAPLMVSGEPGDGSATVTWTTPVSSGSFPITNYQVQLAPGGASCLVSAPSTECQFSDLVNGESYTATVRALNGAGWGPFSAASDPFTPLAPVVASMVITGSRGEVRGRPGVIVQGVTTGMPGQVVTARVRFPGQTTYATGSSRTVNDDGTFSWQRRTAKKVYVVFEGDTVRSNRLIIRTR